MFEVIDTLLGPFFKVNILKYVVSREYRSSTRKALGRESMYIVIYQAVLLALAIFLVGGAILSSG